MPKEEGHVFGYCRVSTTRQVNEGESLDVQQRHIEGWCLQRGLKADAMLIEEGVSGSIPLSGRPKGAALLKRVHRGDTIVAAKLDRLFRSALDALQMVERLKKEGVSLVLGDLGGEDISGNGMSKMFLTIVAAFAEAERDRIRERITQVKRDQALRGRFLGGARPPFGWSVDDGGQLVEEKAEQRAIALMVRLRRKEASLRSIAAAVKKETGLRVSHETVRLALERTAQREGS